MSPLLTDASLSGLSVAITASSIQWGLNKIQIKKVYNKNWVFKYTLLDWNVVEEKTCESSADCDFWGIR